MSELRTFFDQFMFILLFMLTVFNVIKHRIRVVNSQFIFIRCLIKILVQTVCSDVDGHFLARILKIIFNQTNVASVVSFIWQKSVKQLFALIYSRSFLIKMIFGSETYISVRV